MSGLENNSQIEDLNEARTAAHGEDEFRKTVLPGVIEETETRMEKEGLNEQEKDEVRKEYDRAANNAGEKRIRDYNPELEAQLDKVHGQALAFIDRAVAYLNEHYGQEGVDLVGQDVSGIKVKIEELFSDKKGLEKNSIFSILNSIALLKDNISFIRSGSYRILKLNPLVEIPKIIKEMEDSIFANRYS